MSRRSIEHNLACRRKGSPLVSIGLESIGLVFGKGKIQISAIHSMPGRSQTDVDQFWREAFFIQVISIKVWERLPKLELTTNCSTPSSNSSQLTPTPPGCSTGESGFFTTSPTSVKTI